MIIASHSCDSRLPRVCLLQFRMVRHNPDLAAAGKKKRAAKVERVEVVADLEELRQSTMRAIFKKGSQQWTNEVPQSVRAQLEKGRANPTIGLSIL